MTRYTAPPRNAVDAVTRVYRGIPYQVQDAAHWVCDNTAYCAVAAVALRFLAQYMGIKEFVA